MTGSLSTRQAVDDDGGRGDDDATDSYTRTYQPSRELFHVVLPFLPQLLRLSGKPCVEQFALGIEVFAELLGLGIQPRVELCGLGIQPRVEQFALGGNLLLRGGMQPLQARNIFLGRQEGAFRLAGAFQAGDALRQVADLLDNPSLRELFQSFNALF